MPCYPEKNQGNNCPGTIRVSEKKRGCGGDTPQYAKCRPNV